MIGGLEKKLRKIGIIVLASTIGLGVSSNLVKANPYRPTMPTPMMYAGGAVVIPGPGGYRWIMYADPSHLHPAKIYGPDGRVILNPHIPYNYGTTIPPFMFPPGTPLGDAVFGTVKRMYPQFNYQYSDRKYHF